MLIKILYELLNDIIKIFFLSGVALYKKRFFFFKQNINNIFLIILILILIKLKWLILIFNNIEINFFFLNEWLLLFIIVYLFIIWFYENYIEIVFKNILINIMISIYILGIIFILFDVYLIQVNNINFINQLIIINNFNWFIKLILLILSFFIILFTYNYKEYNIKLEFIFLMLISLLGMFLIISSNDLFFLYLSIELMSLPLYILLSSKRSIINIESSVKYFILGSIISIFMLLSITLIYGYFGTTNYFELKDLLILSFNKFNSKNFFYILLSFLFLIVTFFFKLGLVPFHFWVLDLYEGSSLIIIYFISLLPKLAIFIAFYNFFIIFFENLILINYYFFEILVLIGIISVIIGSLGGLKEIKMMRLLGQSSIVNMGFFFIVLINTQLESNWIFLYGYCIYCILLIQIFSILIILKGKIKNIINLMGFFNYSFLFFLIISFCILSLAAIPPLSGFLIKFFIFDSMINLRFFFLVGILLLSSIISTIFYIRLLYYIWFDIQWTNFFFTSISIIESIVIIILFIINISLIFIGEPLFMMFKQIIMLN